MYYQTGTGIIEIDPDDFAYSFDVLGHCGVPATLSCDDSGEIMELIFSGGDLDNIDIDDELISNIKNISSLELVPFDFRVKILGFRDGYINARLIREYV